MRHFLAILLLATCELARAAASLAVSPVRLDLDTRSSAVVLQVVNQGDSAVVVQARVQRWTQQGGEEQLNDDGRLMTSPALFRLMPGKRQIVRIGWPQAPTTTAAHEQAWRVLLDEVPEAGGGKSQGLRMRLQLSIPLFVKGTAPARTQLSWHWRPASPDQPAFLEVINQGSTHARLLGVQIDETAPRSLLCYVLAGASQRIPFPETITPPSRVSYVDDEGSHAQPVHVTEP